MRDTSTLSLHTLPLMSWIKARKKSQTKQKTGSIQKAIHNLVGPESHKKKQKLLKRFRKMFYDSI